MSNITGAIGHLLRHLQIHEEAALLFDVQLGTNNAQPPVADAIAGDRIQVTVYIEA
jgi:hypothetical protein